MKNFAYVVCALALLSGIAFTPAYAEPKLEVIGKFDQRPGNPAVTPDGSIFFSMHPFDKPEYKVMKLVDGKAVPYPSKEFSKSLSAVIGIESGSDGTLWVLDMGSAATSPKLVGIDTASNKVKNLYYLPKEVSEPNSFHQDMVIDEKHGKAFIADMTRGGTAEQNKPAIVVIDLASGASRRVLEANTAFLPEAKATMSAEGKPLTERNDKGEDKPVAFGLNPIAIDPQNEWVYVSTMTPGHIYRIKAETLGDFSKSNAELSKGLESFSEKKSSDGMVADSKGQVFITNVDDNAIDVASKGSLKTWIKNQKLVWADGIAIAPDNSLVVTVNQLNRAEPFNKGKNGAEKPYTIVRISGE